MVPKLICYLCLLMHRKLIFQSGMYTLLLSQALCKYPQLLTPRTVVRVYSFKIARETFEKRKERNLCLHLDSAMDLCFC